MTRVAEANPRSRARWRPRVGVAASCPSASELADPATHAAYAGVTACGEEAVDALRAAGHEAFLVTVRRDVAPAIAELRANGADVVVNFVEELGGDAQGEIRFTRALEAARLPFTGSGARALRLTLDKAASKRALARHGVPVPAFAAFERGGDVAWRERDLPAIVKPLREDGSVGIDRASVCADVPSVRRRVDHVARTFAQPAIVERFIDGREFNVAILEGRRLPISEIEFRGDPARPRIVTFESKWSPGSADDVATRPVCPARVDAALERALRAIAARAFRALGLRDYARIDVRVDASGSPFVLEANGNPDLSSGAGFVRAARAAAIELPALYARLVARASARAELAFAESAR